VLKDFDFEQDSKTFSRLATPAELAEYNAKFPLHADQKGKGDQKKRAVQGFRQPTAQ
jgi:hypothetical protein